MADVYSNAVNSVAPVTPKAYPSIPTQSTNPGGEGYVSPSAAKPAPIVVTSAQAEAGLNGAAQNIQQFNSSVSNNTPLATTLPNGQSNTGGQNAGGAPAAPIQPKTGSTIPQQTVYSYQDPGSSDVSYYDENGNQLSNFDPTQGGVKVTPLNFQPIQPPAQPTFPGANPTGSSSDVSNVNDAITANLNNIQAAGQAGVQALNNFLNGSFTLTPSQQALVNATIQGYNFLIGLQTDANNASVGIATEAAARNERYTPAQSADDVHQAVSDGILRLSGIQAQQAQAVSQMEQGFQQEDFQMVLDANKNYIDAQNSINSTLNSIADRIQSNVQFVQNYQLQVTQDKFSNAMQSASFSLDQKKEAYNEYIQSGQLSLSQKQLAEKTWADQQNIAIQKLQYGLQYAQFEAEFGGSSPASIINGGNQSAIPGTGGAATGTAKQPTNSDGTAPSSGFKYDAKTGQFTDGSGKPITGDALSALKTTLGTAGVRTYDDGLAFLDTSGFTDPKQATGAANAAYNAGIPVLSASDAQVAEKLENAKQNLVTQGQLFQKIASSNPIMAKVDQFTNPLGVFTDSQRYQDLITYNNNRDELIKQINALAGSSPRLNQNELNLAVQALPSLPDFTSNFFGSLNPLARQDTINDGFNKLQLTEKYINDNLSSIVTNFSPTTSSGLMKPGDVVSALAGGGASASAPSTNNDFFNAAGQ